MCEVSVASNYPSKFGSDLCMKEMKCGHTGQQTGRGYNTFFTCICEEMYNKGTFTFVTRKTFSKVDMRYFVSVEIVTCIMRFCGQAHKITLCGQEKERRRQESNL